VFTICSVFQEHNPGIKWDLLVFQYNCVSFWSSKSPLVLVEATNIQCRLLAFEYACNYTGTKSQSSSVSIVTRLGAGWPGVWFPVGEGIFSSCPEHLCQVCSSPNLLFSNYHCLVQHRYIGCGAEATTLSHLVPRLRVTGAKSLVPPMCLHGLHKHNFQLYWHRQDRCWFNFLQFYCQWKN
jgi:hypothetical protein